MSHNDAQSPPLIPMRPQSRKARTAGHYPSWLKWTPSAPQPSFQHHAPLRHTPMTPFGSPHESKPGSKPLNEVGGECHWIILKKEILMWRVQEYFPGKPHSTPGNFSMEVLETFITSGTALTRTRWELHAMSIQPQSQYSHTRPMTSKVNTTPHGANTPTYNHSWLSHTSHQHYKWYTSQVINNPLNTQLQITKVTIKLLFPLA